MPAIRRQPLLSQDSLRRGAQRRHRISKYGSSAPAPKIRSRLASDAEAKAQLKLRMKYFASNPEKAYQLWLEQEQLCLGTLSDRELIDYFWQQKSIVAQRVEEMRLERGKSTVETAIAPWHTHALEHGLGGAAMAGLLYVGLSAVLGVGLLSSVVATGGLTIPLALGVILFGFGAGFLQGAFAREGSRLEEKWRVTASANRVRTELRSERHLLNAMRREMISRKIDPNNPVARKRANPYLARLEQVIKNAPPRPPKPPHDGSHHTSALRQNSGASGPVQASSLRRGN